MNPARAFIFISTADDSGPAKQLRLALSSDREAASRVTVASFQVGRPRARWALKEETEAAGAGFLKLRQRCAHDPSPVIQAYSEIRRKKPQLLVSHDYKSHFLCFLLKPATGLPWIAFCHGWTAENAKIALYGRLDAFVLRFADKVVTVSRAMRADRRLAGVARDRLVTVPNAVEGMAAPPEAGAEVRRRHGLAARDLVVGVVARFSPEKGHAVFVEAFADLARREPRVKALLVGEGQEEPAVRTAVRAAGLEDRVVFAGFRRDVAAYYAAFDVLAVPSLSEGMPNAVLEAMATGVPVVAARVGGIPELIRDGVTGRSVPPGEPRALASAIAEVLSDEALRKDIVRHAEEAALGFGPEARNAKLLDLYGQVVENRRKAA